MPVFVGQSSMATALACAACWMIPTVSGQNVDLCLSCENQAMLVPLIPHQEKRDKSRQIEIEETIFGLCVNLQHRWASCLAVAMMIPFSTDRLSFGKPHTAHCWMMTLLEACETAISCSWSSIDPLNLAMMQSMVPFWMIKTSQILPLTVLQ